MTLKSQILSLRDGFSDVSQNILASPETQSSDATTELNEKILKRLKKIEKKLKKLKHAVRSKK